MFGPIPSMLRSQYDLLPVRETEGGRMSLAFRAQRLLKRRGNHFILLLLLASLFITTRYLLTSSPAEPATAALEPEPEPLPPLYYEWHKEELALPQHYVFDPFADGKKYMWISGHTHSSGWGNFMQDMVLNAQLVYMTGRSFVFDNFTWDRDGGEYSDFNGKKIPSRIPLSALISGPIAGGQLPDEDTTPQAVVKEYFDKICPEKTYIRADELQALHGNDATATQIIETWLEHVKAIDDPCLEVARDSGNIFNIFMFGSPRQILPVWPALSKSPIVLLFGWGSLAHQSLEANRHLFSPAPLIKPYVAKPSCPSCVDEYAPLDGLLALHLRRGDFLEHCQNLGLWGAGFQAFNSFPEFPDQWEFPEGSQDEKSKVYMQRCLPTFNQIVEKIRRVREAKGSEGLKTIYIMSNGDRQWLADLKRVLYSTGGWQSIVSSRDIDLTPEQKYVSHTMDMLIGQRAQVIIGNGFSSMTAGISLLRMARQVPPETTHMW